MEQVISSPLFWTGGGILVVVFSILVLIKTKASKKAGHCLVRAEINVTKSDPRFEPDPLESEEALAMSARSVRSEPRAMKEIITMPDSRLNQEIASAIEAARNGPSTSPGAWISLGRALARSKLYRASAMAFKKALEIEENAGTYHYLAACFHKMDKTRWAVEALKAALGKERTNAGTHSMLGYMYLALGKQADAAVHLARAMSLDPERPEPHLGLAWIHGNRNELFDFEQELEIAALCGNDWLEASESVRLGVNPVDILDWTYVFEETRGNTEAHGAGTGGIVETGRSYVNHS